MIKLRDVRKSYKDKIIFRRSEFSAKSGNIVLLTGKSGVGKSTFLDIIAGIKQFDCGRYFFKKQEIFPADDRWMSRFRNQYIGYILQDFALIEEYTVLENCILPSLYQSKISKKEVVQRIEELIRNFNLDKELLNNKVKSLSGGQKQRVAILRSLLLNPVIILADEPTSNLDNANFELVVDTFLRLRAEGKTIIIATHDSRLEAIADKIYLIENQDLSVIC